MKATTSFRCRFRIEANRNNSIRTSKNPEKDIQNVGCLGKCFHSSDSFLARTDCICLQGAKSPRVILSDQNFTDFEIKALPVRSMFQFFKSSILFNTILFWDTLFGTAFFLWYVYYYNSTVKFDLRRSNKLKFNILAWFLLDIKFPFYNPLKSQLLNGSSAKWEHIEIIKVHSIIILAHTDIGPVPI